MHCAPGESLTTVAVHYVDWKGLDYHVVRQIISALAAWLGMAT